MASGDLALLKNYSPGVAGLCLLHDGATIYVALKSGDVYSYTIAGGATAKAAHLNPQDITAMDVNATDVYIGYANGALLQYTIATKADVQIAKFDSPIVSISISDAGKIYVGLADGHLYSYEI